MNKLQSRVYANVDVRVLGMDVRVHFELGAVCSILVLSVRMLLFDLLVGEIILGL